MGKSLTPPRAHESRLDLHPNVRVYHSKFGCTSSYRDWMHSEQTNILLYLLNISSVISFHSLCVLYSYRSWVISSYLLPMLHSMDISIHMVALHLMHSTRFLSSILRSLVPNGKKRRFLSTFVLDLSRKQPYDLLLVERGLPAKFHCIWSYRVQMHK